jgi:hypothetical protein
MSGSGSRGVRHLTPGVDEEDGDENEYGERGDSKLSTQSKALTAVDEEDGDENEYEEHGDSKLSTQSKADARDFKASSYGKSEPCSACPPLC